VHMQVQTAWESNSNSPRYPRKLKFTNFWRHFGLQICRSAPKIVVPDQGENWCRQSWRHKETIDISCAPQFVHLSRDMAKTRSLYIKQLVMRTMVLLRCPAQFCEVRSEFFSSSLNSHVQRDWVSALFLFFIFFTFWQVLVAFVFFRGVGSVISLGKK